MADPEFDVVIVGAGISGIGAACHLTEKCPERSYVILEQRDDIGGTWDLFRYPGLRSDSDMFTFGYSFRPWTDTQSLADAGSIKSYLRDTAEEYDVLGNIRFGRQVTDASWSSEDGFWTLTTRDRETGEIEEHTGRFLFECTGYYNYEHGHVVDFPGEEDFEGPVIHPQKWPEDLDYSDRKIVVIGSGATSITLVPALAETAEHVTMLQRSPTYVMAMPGRDRLAEFLHRFLPEWIVYRIIRTRNILLQRLFYDLFQTFPNFSRGLIQKQMRAQLGEDYDMRHFTPDYDPWDQRLCVVPDGDLFKTIRRGDASVVTDHIERFTENGILLEDGQDLEEGRELEADMIVTATGLDLQMMGGIDLEVDGEPVAQSERMIYKGVMIEGVPNAATTFGYINASWTLKVDLVCEYVCRLLNHMGERGYAAAVPRNHEGVETDGYVMDELKANYIQRAADRLPRNGAKSPWKEKNNYLYDWWRMHFGSLEDDELDFYEDPAPIAPSRGMAPQENGTGESAPAPPHGAESARETSAAG